MIGIAILKANEMDGIKLTDTPIGKQYIVHLKPITLMWLNKDTNKEKQIQALMDIETGGFLPLELVELRGCVVNIPADN